MTVAVSQNGWKANDRSLIASYKVPGGKLAMRKGDVATILVYVVNRFHNEVEKLEWPGCWGYAERPIRGGSALSNHASGTAVDLNAPQHWLGARGTFTKGQVAAIRRILNACEGVIRWGGDYRNRKDEMHFEINRGSAAVRALAKKIRAGEKQGGKGAPAPSSKWKAVKYGDQLRNGVQGPPVREWQEFGLGYTGSKVDGYFGDDTERDTKSVQKRNGLPQTGVVDSKTWATRRRPKPKPKSSAPKFPWPNDHWIGRESNNAKNHSGALKKDEPGIRQWQSKMKSRGWELTVDGEFGPASEKIARQFQKEKGLKVTGKVDLKTWNATWNEKVT